MNDSQYKKYAIIAFVIILMILLFLTISHPNKSLEIPAGKDLIGDAPGMMVGIWKGGNLVQKKLIGEGNIMNHKPMSWNNHFRVGSITKTFTVTVITILIGKGLIGLHDPASMYFKFVPDGITVEQLGNMTSGLYNYSEDDAFNRMLDETPDRHWNNLELIAISKQHGLLFPPGKGWHYSNTGLIILGMIAESVTGKSMRDLYYELIINPLELKNTYIPKEGEIPTPFHNGYMKGYNDTERKPKSVLRDVTHDNPSWAGYAGYIISTMDDIGKYARALGNGEIIGKKLNKLRENTFVSAGKIDYGFGIMKFHGEWLGHNGTIPGYQSMMLYSPTRDMTIVVTSNLYENTNVGASDEAMMEILMSIH